MWIALAIMTTESIVSLIPVISDSVRQIRRLHSHSSNSDYTVMEEEDPEPPQRLVPTRWALWGLVGSAFFGTIIIRLVFGTQGINPWASLVGFVLAALLSLLG